MEQTADKLHHEYWRPANPTGKREMPMDARLRSEVCEGCGSEFIIGARFCHVCGTSRRDEATATPKWMEALDFERIRGALGLSIGSLVAFIFGVICVIAAAVVGFIYSANTLVDWQAVQTWRIEWMLAAVVAFVAGILLKKQ